jgi:hypothetical protein
MWKTYADRTHASSCPCQILPSLLRVRDRPGIDDLSIIRLPRKEVIQPHLPVRLPCYDFTPITDPTLDACPLAVSPAASGVADFRGVTGGVYKTRERIHRSVLTYGY